MTWGFLILNAAYVVYVVSAVFKDMLRLRLLLFVATILYIVYGFMTPLWPLVYWNIPFGAMQLYQIWVLLKQRVGIDLSDEAEAVRVLMFSDLDRPLFNVLWQSGHQAIYRDGDTLIEYGTDVEHLMIVLEGEVAVRPADRDPDDPIRLGRLRLLGEMSAISGETARATVTATGLVRTRSWRQSELAELGKAHPEIQKNALLVMGSELTRKII